MRGGDSRVIRAALAAVVAIGLAWTAPAAVRAQAPGELRVDRKSVV